jgi:circadian clock protein KaiC
MNVSTGLKEMDSMLGKGFPGKTVILLSGGPGTGKTLFSLNFLLEGARKKERCCYVSLSETSEELVRACKGIESLSDVEKYLGKTLAIEHISLGENITLKKFIEIISNYPKLDRLVIDNVNKLLIFAESPKSYRLNLSELVRHLRGMGCTLLVCETGDDDMDSGNSEAFECDGVVQLSFLDLEEKPMRTLMVHKLRYSSFEPRVPRELTVDGKGLRMGDASII